MSNSLKSLGAITLFVDDPKRSKAFYERVFDVAAVYEDENSAAFKFENTIVNLLARSRGGRAGRAGSGRGRRRGSTFQLTIWVDDADAVCAELANRGVSC